MKKNLLAVAIASAVMLSAAPAFAVDSVEYMCTNTDMTKLTPAQVENIKALCAKPDTPDQAAAVAGVTPDKVRQWGSLGKEFSTAIVETARGLGVAANDLLFTPVGFMIAFYFMWDMVGGILIGIPLLIALWIAYWRIGTYLMTDEVTYENKPVLWGAFTVKKVVSKTYANGPEQSAPWWFFLGGVASILLSWAIIGILIF